MPKLKQVSTLQDLALQTLGASIMRIRHKSINTSDLYHYLYDDLPCSLSHKLTSHILSEVKLAITDYTGKEFSSVYTYVKNTIKRIFFGSTSQEDTIKDIVLGSVYRNITFLDTIHLDMYVQNILICNIHMLKQLRTLLISETLPENVVETIPKGLRSLNFLVNFQMQYNCSDDVIQTLGSCCPTTIEYINANYSVCVTNASLKIFMKCQKLKHLSICGTEVTAEEYSQFLLSIEQRKKSHDTAEGLLCVGVGSEVYWDVSSKQLKEIVISCPMLQKLNICGNLSGDMEALVSLTTLEVLDIIAFDFHKCNLDGFLRVRGSTLISLSLQIADSIDLTCIMNHCINIKKLVLQGTIVDTASGNVQYAANALQNLEILHLNCGLSALIERMLYACVNLTRLCLEYCQEDMTDEFILRFLSNNPLRKLTSFSTNSTALTIRSVKAIIEHCPLLEELKCFHSDPITRTEVNIIRQQIKDQNQDLKI